MPHLDNLELFIRVTKRRCPKCYESLLWRRARDKALERAKRADIWDPFSPTHRPGSFVDDDEKWDRSWREHLKEQIGNKPLPPIEPPWDDARDCLLDIEDSLREYHKGASADKVQSLYSELEKLQKQYEADDPRLG